MRLQHFRWLAGACLSAFLASPAAFAAGSPAVPPGESVEQRTQEEWSRAWWQWAGSFDRSESPVADRTGALCGRRQEGPVWFLAGTYGTHRTIRECHVPRGKYLFFPLINYVVMQAGAGAEDCDSYIAQAALMTEGATGLVLEVDDLRVEHLVAHRQATRECFDIARFMVPRPRPVPAAANGYYVMLRPLPPGRHTIEFGGVLPSMMQAVSYTLIVD